MHLSQAADRAAPEALQAALARVAGGGSRVAALGARVGELTEEVVRARAVRAAAEAALKVGAAVCLCACVCTCVACARAGITREGEAGGVCVGQNRRLVWFSGTS